MRSVAVSVIVPSYNHGEFLGECIESVLSQTFEDWELIIVDDRSSDNSLEVARSYGDRRIRVHENDSNLGTYGNENRGLSLANGQYVAILNSDDKWLPNKLKRQVEGFSRFPQASFSYHLGAVTDGAGVPFVDMEQHGDWPLDELQDLLPHLFICNRALASSTMWRREGTHFDESLRYSGDWEMALTAARRGPVHFVNESLSIWRKHGRNMSNQMHGVFLEDIRFRRAILENIERWFVPHSDHRLVRSKLAACALSLNTLYFAAGDRANAEWASRLAQQLAPRSKTAALRRLGQLLPTSMVCRRICPEIDRHSFAAAYQKGSEMISRSVHFDSSEAASLR